MGGVHLDLPKSACWDKTKPLNTEQISVLVGKDYINVDKLRDLSVDSIDDKSKGDFFTKSLAVLQVLYLIITLVIRWWRHLAITQLEILAVAFAICSVLTYGFRWKKPKDVQTAIKVRGGSHSAGVTRDHVQMLMHDIMDFQSDSILEKLTQHRLNIRSHEWRPRIPNDNFEHSAGSVQPVAIVLALSTVSNIF